MLENSKEVKLSLLMENKNKQVGLKSFIIGALLCFLIPVMAHYSIDIVHGSYMAIDFMPAGAILASTIFLVISPNSSHVMGSDFDKGAMPAFFNISAL